jgi:hypothetical protein
LAEISNTIFQSLPVRYTLHLVFDNPSLYVYVLLVGLLIALIRRQRTATLILIPVLIYFLGLLISTPVADFRYVYPLIPLLLVATILLFQKKPVSAANNQLNDSSESSTNVDKTEPGDANIPANGSTADEVNSTENDNVSESTAESDHDDTPTQEYDLPTAIRARGAIPPTIYNARSQTQSLGANSARSGVSTNVSVPPTIIPGRQSNQSDGQSAKQAVGQTAGQAAGQSSENATQHSDALTGLTLPEQNYPIYPSGSTLTPSTPSTK